MYEEPESTVEPKVEAPQVETLKLTAQEFFVSLPMEKKLIGRVIVNEYKGKKMSQQEWENVYETVSKRTA